MEASARNMLDDVVQENQVLGTGSYGVVFRGRWRGIGVAIKRLHPRIRTNESSDEPAKCVMKFVDEWETLKSVHHSHIVQYFGMTPATGSGDSSTPGLVTEMMALTLRERYKGSPPLTLRQQLSIAAGVAAGLCYLHHASVNIVHRDLTTNNIMLTDKLGCHAKITDIGGAKKLLEVGATEFMTKCPGSMCYMAPETLSMLEAQLLSAENGGDDGEDEKAKYGVPVDIFAFAVAMTAMVVRREPRPFSLGVRDRDNDLKQVRGHPLGDVIVECMSESPTERPTAAALCSAIQDMLDGEPSCADDGAAAGGSDDNSTVQDIGEQRRTSALKQAAAAAAAAEVQDVVQRAQGRTRALEMENARMLTEIDALRERLAACSCCAQGQALVLKPELALSILRLRKANRVLYESVVDMSLSFFLTPGQREKVRASAEAALLLSGSPRNGAPPSASHFMAQWSTQGSLPPVELTSRSIPCLADGRLNLKLAYPSCQPALLVSGSDVISETSWESQDLPPETGISSFFFQYQGEMLHLCTDEAQHSAPVLWRRSSGGGDWERVLAFEIPRAYYGAAIVGKHLVLVGGCTVTSAGDEVPELSVECVCLDNSNLSTLPSLPRACYHPEVVDYRNRVTVIGGDAYPDGDCLEMLSVDMCNSDAGWSRAELPRLEHGRCAAAVVNDSLVVAGGNADANGGHCRTTVANVYMLDDGQQRQQQPAVWRRLPPLPSPSQDGTLLFHDDRLIYMCGSVFRRGHWEMTRTVEVLDI